MKILQKRPDRDFRILNLTDPQLSDAEWEDGRKEGRLLTNTVSTLVERIAPDLITVTGDLAWAGNNESYRRLASLLDSFDIPWAPVFGNHDIQGGPEKLYKAAKILTSGKNCLFDAGEPSLGCGNYTIGIEQNGVLIHGLIMMDSHDRKEYTGPDGKTVLAWADIEQEQFPWYREQIRALSDAGAKESTLIMHIPLYTYREAAEAAFKEGVDTKSLAPDCRFSDGCYNPGYEDAFGTMYEGIASYPTDNGFFGVIKECGHTKTVLAGHDHVNNFSIPYCGVRLLYALKTGPGCYWNPKMNGGTLLTVDKNGQLTAEHIYVEPKGSE